MLIFMVLLTMRGITHQKFRDDMGDATTEIGYEEDSEGHDIHDYKETTNDVKEEPHVTVPTGASSS